MNRNWTIALVAVILLGIAGFCICAVLGLGALTFFAPTSREVIDQPAGDTPVVIRPTAQMTPQPASPIPPTREGATLQPPSTPETARPTGQAEATPTPAANSSLPADTLSILETSEVPVNNLVDLAQRLQGKKDVPATLTPPAAPLQVGDQSTFWVTNTNTNTNSQINATLQYVTDHVYFWVQNGVRYQQSEMKQLVDTFERKIYPTNREFFGSEWTPGIDGDPHLYIVFARGLGGSVVGYFSSPDEYPPQVAEYSNGHEMFMLSADLADLSDSFTYGVLAHEFQHMIHWNGDRNEDTWVNEGFAELAAFINGYDVGGHDLAYVLRPDTQLNDWSSPNEESNSAHYGGAFLFNAYFLSRFGEDLTKAVVANDANGFVSYDQVLAQAGEKDPETQQPLTANDVFADWVLANFLNDAKIAKGQYAYANYPRAPRPDVTEDIRSCGSEWTTRDVSQYGVDYISIRCPQSTTLSFEGTVQVGVLPTDAHSGRFMFWSNKGDESDMTLTRSFDFTGQSGTLTLNYSTWYDIEQDYDYAYLEASTDGLNWQILNTPSCTSADPSGNSYGCGYNGESGGGPRWIQESVDISQFAGQKVQLRFEYVTDAAVNGNGLALDDIAIPEIGYSTDLEQDTGGWEGLGFVRIENVLPQSFRLALIQGRDTVQKWALSGDNALEITIPANQEVVLVVSGTAPFTRQKAAYRFQFSP